MKIFIDTNIFLDALLKREPFKKYAEELLNLCDERVFTAFTSCVSFINITYFLQKFNKCSYTESLEKDFKHDNYYSFGKQRFPKSTES